MSEIKSFIEGVREKYGRCNSYRDTGIATSTHKERSYETHFQTYFLRPNCFRYEWQRYTDGKPGRKNAICSNGEHTSVNATKIESLANLEEALASAIGGSEGTVLIVAQLLIAKLRMSFPADLDAVLDDDEPLLERDFYVLTALNRKIWISKNDHTIRKAKIDHFSEGMEYELAEREKLLARTLNRPVIISENNRWVTECKYERVIFDEMLDRNVFDFPWKSET